jgi:hypothetical protein
MEAPAACTLNESLARLAAAGASWQVLVPGIDTVAAAEAARLRSPAVPTAA